MKKPTVIFIPYFKAKIKNIRKNVEFIESLHFETKVFEPPYYGRPFRDVLKSILTGGLKSNFIDRWSYDLNEWLYKNDIRQREIIFYSFSAPSFMVLNYMFKFKDVNVKAWVCEGGPFTYFLECLFNYMFYAEKVKFLPKRVFFVFTDYFLWGGFFKNKRVLKEIKSFPPSVPILSIRGLKDKITPIYAIEDLFKPHRHLNLRALNLNCPHLRGISDCESLYKKQVSEFLKQLPPQKNLWVPGRSQ